MAKDYLTRDDLKARMLELSDELQSFEPEEAELAAQVRAELESASQALEELGEDGLYIHEYAFTDYAMQVADDLLGMDFGSWPCTYINWESAARELRLGYKRVDICGEPYYTRY